MAANMISLKFICVIVLTIFTTVYSHGILCTPRQRGAYHSRRCGSNLPIPPKPVNDYCPHCLNGGTVANVFKHLPKSGWSLYDPIKNPSSRNRAGLCGDPFGDDSHMIGGRYMPYRDTPIVTHWKTGSIVDLEVEIDTNHNGYYEFFLCNLDRCRSKDISGKCMQSGHCHRLKRAPHPDCQNPSIKTHFECGPIDKRRPSRWYVPCRKTGHVGIHIVGGTRGTMRYVLPKYMNCDHCVLQWYWATANSCAPSGFLDYFKTYKNPFGVTCDSDGGGRGAHRPGMITCGGPLAPEEFWSCADVKISPKGRQAPPAKKLRSFGIQTIAPPKNSKNPVPGHSPGQPGIPGNVSCTKSNKVCNGKTTCCYEHVCAHAQKGGFQCKLWYSLWKEVIGDKSRCISRNKACNGKIPCCHEHVCALSRQGKYVCKLWYSLWEEALG